MQAGGKSLLATLTIVAALAGSGAAMAHEFWIEPETFRATSPGDTAAQLRVGQNLSGAALPYLSSVIRESRHWAPSGDTLIEGREGDLPALSFAPEDPGLHRLNTVTHPAYIVFGDIAEFSDYLDYEGLGAVIERHRARDLAEVDIAEAYIRYARALVQSGPVASGQDDAPTGMEFELVALQNPYRPETDEFQVRLTWQGGPSVDVQVSIFHLSPQGSAPDDTVRTITRTDASGVANIPLSGPGQYLLNAVRMEPVEGPGSVVWQSHWASLTFEID